MKKQTKSNIIILILLLIIASIIGLVFLGVAKALNWDIKGFYCFVASTFLSILLFLLRFLYPKLSFSKQWKRDLHRLMKDDSVKTIRISFAYLYRILVDGKYLLVKNQKGTERFQPVGGAYKCYQNEKIFLAQSYSVADDDCILIDTSSRNDYRMRVPKEYLKKFLKRFDITKERESINDLSREFAEEFLEASIDMNSFASIKYRYCGRHLTGIDFSAFNCYELLLADIIELQMSDEQLNSLLKTQETKSKKFIWATETEIRSLGIKLGTNKLKDSIANHTYKILQTTEISLLKPKTKNQIYHVNIAKNS